MSVDPHEACSAFLNQYLQAQEATRQFEVGAYNDALAEFEEDLQDVFSICGLLEDDALAAFPDLYHQFINEPFPDTVTTPKFWADLLDAAGGLIALGGPCLFEIAGAMKSESSFRHLEAQRNALASAEEQARRAYVGCLRQAGFQKSRREQTIGPPLGG